MTIKATTYKAIEHVVNDVGDGGAIATALNTLTTAVSSATLTQTYSTSTETHAARTASDLTDSSGGTPATTLPATIGIQTITHPLTSLATGLSTSAIDIMTAYTPGYAFKILGLDFVTTVAGTGSGASQVFNLEIGTTNVTGGVCTVTLASTDTIGKITAGTAVTATNTGTAADTISIEMAASGTVFTAGAGYFLIKLQNMDTVNAISSLGAQHDALKVDSDNTAQFANKLADAMQTKGFLS